MQEYKKSTIEDLMKRMNIKKNHFRKGDKLINIPNEHGIVIRVKVIMYDNYSILVKDLDDSKRIPYTINNEKLKNFTVMTPENLKVFKLEKRDRRLILNPLRIIMDIGLWAQTKLNLGHNIKPTAISQYVGNWIAFMVTFAARLEADYWDRKNQYSGDKKRTFFEIMKNSAPHGPLWKDHDYTEK